MYVIPLANAFRASYGPALRRLAAFVRKLRIPVVVVGVGAQLLPDREFDDLPEDLHSASREFVAAVLEHSASVGVRGEITRAYLNYLGFPNSTIDIIGCPSVFLNGPGLSVAKRVDRLGSDSRIALNVTPSKGAFAEMIGRSVEAYPHLTYIPQEHTDLAMMMWGEDRTTRLDPRMPTHTSHPLYRQNRMRSFVDAYPWIDYLRGQDFAFGSRIHGNVAAIIAQTPAYVIAHDSRTRELAEYHAIPHRMLGDLAPGTDPADLYAEADYSAFNRRYPETFEAYQNFLTRNEVPHVFSSPEHAPAEFDAAMAATPFPGPIEVLGHGDPAFNDVRARLRWLRQGSTTDRHRAVGAFQPEFSPSGKGKPVSVHEQVSSLTAEVAALKKQLRAVQARLDATEGSGRVSLWKRGRRLADRVRRGISGRGSRGRTE